MVLWKVRSASLAHSARCSVDGINCHIMSGFRMSGVTLPWRKQGKRPPYFYPVLYFGSHLHCTVCRVAACAGTAVHVCGCGVVVSVASVKCVCKYSSSVVFRRTDGRTDGRFLTLEFNARAFLNRLPIHWPPSHACTACRCKLHFMFCVRSLLSCLQHWCITWRPSGSHGN